MAKKAEYSPQEIEELLPRLPKSEREELERMVREDLQKHPWRPMPGPQTMAYESKADVVGLGGSAGGGKSDMAVGLALTKHKKSAILRREATQLTALIDRCIELHGSRKGYNGQDKILRLGWGRQIEFGSTPNLGDETKHQGRPKDLLAFDEATNFLYHQVRYLMGWCRTNDPNQKTTVLMTFNPPTSAEGRWVIDFFAPWLDEKHPNPAKPGELRYFATIGDGDIEVPDGREFVLDANNEPVYEFDRRRYRREEIIRPQSRTFIPSRVSDNPFYLNSNYLTQLQGMPEPLRSQMLFGDFKAGMEDDMYQIIPTEWVDMAMERWEPRKKKGAMSSMGVDPCRGGRDKTAIIRRHDSWFDKPLKFDGSQSPDGPTVAAQVLGLRRDQAPVHIDMTGWGASPYDFLVSNGIHTVGVNFASGSNGLAEKNRMKFINIRAEIWWRMREALDPDASDPLSLPPDSELKADLCAPRWMLRAGGIQVEDKDKTKERIGRSPDLGDAACLALISTVKEADMPNRKQARARTDHDPLDPESRHRGEFIPGKASRDHDPH